MGKPFDLEKLQPQASLTSAADEPTRETPQRRARLELIPQTLGCDFHAGVWQTFRFR